MASLRKIERELLACRAELRWLGAEGQSKDNTARVARMLDALTAKLNESGRYASLQEGRIKAGIEIFINTLKNIQYNADVFNPTEHAKVVAIVHSMAEFMHDIHALAGTFMQGNEEQYTDGVIRALMAYTVSGARSVSAFLQLFADIGTSLSDPAQYANVPDDAKEIKTIMPEIGQIIASV